MDGKRVDSFKNKTDLNKAVVSVCYFAKAEKAIEEIKNGKPFAYAVSAAPFLKTFCTSTIKSLSQG